MKTSPLVMAALASATFLCSACESYDPPPEVKLLQPTDGFWTALSAIELRFTEAIDPTTLVVSVWPYEVDLEGDFRPDVVPLFEACRVGGNDSGCGSLAIEVDETRTRATLRQNGVFADLIGRPLRLEVHAGLADLAGRTRDVPTYLDFQINPLCNDLPVDIELDTGVISLAADLNPLPFWLQMFIDFAIDPDSGRFYALGTFARVRPGGSPNENHPTSLMADISDNGWAVMFTGCVVAQDDGGYFLQSDPIDVSLVLLKTIPLELNRFQLQGTIRPGLSEDGRDYAVGTLSTSGGRYVLVDRPQIIEPLTAPWDGFSVIGEEIVEGLPRVCETSPCAELEAAGGDCQSAPVGDQVCR